MKNYLAIGMLALLSACSGEHGGSMSAQLDDIRVMIKQSALMAANAACGGKAKDGLIRAAAAMNRRAMGGPEMAEIHKMMGMQADAGGAMPMQMKKDAPMSPEMRRHKALHDAGEAVFDYLEAAGEGKATCANSEAVRLAADAAMLREAGGGETARAADDADARAAAAMPGVPAAVKSLVSALQNI